MEPGGPPLLDAMPGPVMDDAAAWKQAERIVLRDFSRGGVVAREWLRRTADGGAIALLGVGSAGVGMRGATMRARLHVPPPG